MSILITNGIALIKEPKIITPRLCNDLITYIDSSELNKNDQNVQCENIDLISTDKLHARVFKLFLELRTCIRQYLYIDV